MLSRIDIAGFILPGHELLISTTTPAMRPPWSCVGAAARNSRPREEPPLAIHRGLQQRRGADEETQMGSTSITSNAATYNFPNNLSGPTGHRWIVIATHGFAQLPGAPAPDYIMPDGFFNPVADTLRYRGVTDMIQFAVGELPTNGIDSLQRDLQTGMTTVGVNSPI